LEVEMNKVLGLILLLLTPSLHLLGQAHETVLHSFGSAGDGEYPNGGLVFVSGSLYGTTVGGGSFKGGTVFELSPGSGGGWIETILYNFCQSQGCPDGVGPEAGLIADSAGNLYGTTVGGGAYDGGTVFELSPERGGNWSQSIIWSLGEAGDGSGPSERLTFDTAGNLYGVAGGGPLGGGVVFKLSSGSSGWTESVLYSFCQTGGRKCTDGAAPGGGVSFDKVGNIYGTTSAGGFYNDGVLYELTPPTQGGVWGENVLYTFLPESGVNPLSKVNFDSSGNAYVTASGGKGSATCGSVMRFTPQAGGGGTKTSVLFGLGDIACGPRSGVFIDPKNGTIYGSATSGGSEGGGSIYKIVGHTLSQVYGFCSLANCADGELPDGSLTADRDGNLYSNTNRGGEYGFGVVFELTP